MRRRLITVVAALLLAALGTFGLVGFVQSAEERALAGERTVEVFVATDEIPRGTPAEQLADRVTTTRVPVKVRADGSVEDLDALEGRVAEVAMLPGEQLNDHRFVTPAQLEDRAVELPDGLQEVTVSLEPQRAVGGRLAPGDLVGLLASFSPDVRPYNTKLTVNELLVTEVQVEQMPTQPPAGEDGEEAEDAPSLAPTGSLLVTLAVDVDQVERIVFAAEHGTVWLTGQDEDTEHGGSAVREAETIFDE